VESWGVRKMNVTFTAKLVLAVLSPAALICAQTMTSQTGAPVSYTSSNQLNGILSQVQQTSQGMQNDLSRLRIDKWKTDGNTKRQSQGNVESIQRNLQSAIPEIITALRNSPENLAETFRMYRNLDALYDVFSNVVESAGAFGPKDDFQALENDLGALETTRHAVADRMETLANAKESELNRLRTEIRAAQAAPPSPPKKVIVDDTEPPKKSVKKKSTTKKPTSSNSTTSTTKPPPSQ
jgi:DNA repair exonuclease SbcCD ATPase subunit